MTDVLLTFRELCRFVKADESVVLSLIEAGSIPPPVNIGNRLVRWVESDLVRWVHMGCPSFPPPTSEELVLIRSNDLEEEHHAPADVGSGLEADQPSHDQ
jgi:predicted DNA-binding transcriptional regulator AlpA